MLVSLKTIEQLNIARFPTLLSGARATTLEPSAATIRPIARMINARIFLVDTVHLGRRPSTRRMYLRAIQRQGIFGWIIYAADNWWRGWRLCNFSQSTQRRNRSYLIPKTLKSTFITALSVLFTRSSVMTSQQVARLNKSSDHEGL